jgi:hypothetical protein
MVLWVFFLFFSFLGRVLKPLKCSCGSFYFGGTRVGTEGFMQSRCYTTSATPAVYFALVTFEIGSHELFAWAGLRAVILPIFQLG